MTKEQLAELLNGREYSEEIDHYEEVGAKKDGLVVVFGYSDDAVELRGAIHDEVGAYDGTTLYFDNAGLLENKCDDEDCPYHEEAKKTAKTIEAVSDMSGKGDYCWTFKTDIPHATFDIMEEGDKFCKGIVFEINALSATQEATTI